MPRLRRALAAGAVLLLAPALFAVFGAAASNDPELATTAGAVDDIDYSNYLDRVEREAAKKEKTEAIDYSNYLDRVEREAAKKEQALEARTPSRTADRVHTTE